MKNTNLIYNGFKVFILILALFESVFSYLILVSETRKPGDVIFNASVYKLGSDRHYKINTDRTANFVHHIIHVDSTNGRIYLRKRLKCDGINYPNLFTFYVDSTSDRVRDIDFYSLPIRILVTGQDCSRKSVDMFYQDFDDTTELSDQHARDEMDLSSSNENLDWRVLEEDGTYSSHLDGKLLQGYGTHSSSKDKNRLKRSQNNVPFDMAIDIKLSEAKQWISETFASFAIPTTDKWQQICLRKSQFINSLSAFLPQSINKNCKVQFLDVSDNRFVIENSQSDLVASQDVCIQEPLWKVTVLFTFNCNSAILVDSDHRLKIVYHHQEFNDTDIARRIRRELRNQSPFFEQALYVASVAEEQLPGILVTTVRARDPEKSPVTYSMSSLLDSRSAGMFGVDARSGAVTTLARLDRERLDVHYFRLVARDDTFPPRSGTTTLQINVLDCNDHAPIFELQQYEASVREGASPDTVIITLKATDQDIGKNAEVEYLIEYVQEDNTPTIEDIADNESSSRSETNGTHETYLDMQEVFRIDARTGALLTRSKLDREKVVRYIVTVKATDQAMPVTDRLSSSAIVYINILDDNDNYPQFTERTYTVLVDEDINISDNPIIARIKATDADIGVNAAIRYAIIGGNSQMQFSIDSLSGDVSLVKPLDYELVRSYRLVIRAQDGGSPSRSNTTQLLVNVRDVNDNAPRFYTSLFQESVSENVAIGYSIVRVQAYDADEGVNAELSYKLNDKDFIMQDKFPLNIDPRTGWIYTVKQLDREEFAKYQLQVVATDGGIPPHSATASVAIVVQDVNDNDPVFSPNQYEATVAEDEPPGTPVVTVTATDADEDNRLHYEISAGNTRGRFAISSQNGRGLITVAQPLDYKQERRYVLTITATDSGGRLDSALVHINVSDANNYAPVFENAPYSASVFEDAPIGTTVLVVAASDNDVGINAQITYSLGVEISNDAINSENEFVINPQTGAILTNKLLDREAMSGYLLTVTARDGGTPSLSDTTDVEISIVDVNDNKPVFKQQLYSATVTEDALVGTSVIQISATDADVGLNGRIHYDLSAKDREDGSFVVDKSSGIIRTNKALDRESVASYDIRALAIDGGTPAMSTMVVVHIRIEDINDSPPVFESDRLILYIAENSPIGTTVGEIHANDPDEGINAIVHYSIKGGDDSNSFSLETRQGLDRAYLVTMVDLDYESPRKKYELVIRAASPPLWSDVHIDILVTDVNDNAPVLKDFQVIFNNYQDCFPVGTFGRVPAFDADVGDKLNYRILSGNNANLVLLNDTTGGMTLSPQLNTNVPKLATMEISVSDGVNEAKAVMQLSVRLITEEMLFNSITVRLNDMTAETFLSPLLLYFFDGLAAIIPCPKENIYIFSMQDDTQIGTSILNVSFSARRPDAEVTSLGDTTQYYTPTYLRERIYLNRATLARLATVQVLPFDDNVCVHEPCLNYEHCLTVLKFGNASTFIHSDVVLFRPIYPVATFACQCPNGFTGLKDHYMCDTEVDLCYSSPCTNGGSCMRREGGYSCVCSPGFTGVNCETILKKAQCEDNVICRGGAQCVPSREGGILCQGCSFSANYTTPLCELRARSFSRMSFLTFPSLKQRHRLHIQLRFATKNTNGLLLYNGRYNERHDFIALEVIGTGAGRKSRSGIRFMFSLGGSISEVTVGGDVADGNWHTIELEYLDRKVTLSLDDCDKAISLISSGIDLGDKWACANETYKELPDRCNIPTETCHRFFDLTGPMQIGGLPSIPTSFQVKTEDFRGCIADLYIDHKFVDLNNYVADNGTVPGCPEKQSHCDSNPCYNGATCQEVWDTFLCDCAEGFTGKDCGESTSLPWRFNGDGILSFNPLLRPIQLPWLNALSVRTRLQDTFLMSIQIGQNSSAIISLKSGMLQYTYNNENMFVPGSIISDGEWHRIEMKWIGTDIAINIDYGLKNTLLPILANKIQGLYIGKILIGGPDSTSSMLAADYGYFEGCIQDVRVGNAQSLLSRPTVRENVRDGCQSRADCLLSACATNGLCVARWDTTDCSCGPGQVGSDCRAACSLQPCGAHGLCVEDVVGPRGYTCKCLNNTQLIGNQCVEQKTTPCPSGWWGTRGCGPCNCPIEQGYHPDCNKKTGECFCKENHYQPPGSTKCMACQCYTVGSMTSSCDINTGQCPCRTGVIGRACNTCPNPYAEVTPEGCQVVYDGCPRSFSQGVWWPRTSFGFIAISHCPSGTSGKASRACDKMQNIPWQEPDMFNCTSSTFYQLRTQLNQIENEEIQLNTFVAVKIAEDLRKACENTSDMYGADILISESILLLLLNHEILQKGLNLTHSQDKDYIKNIVKSANDILHYRYKSIWYKINELTGHGAEYLVLSLDKYISILAESQHDTYTSPFEIVTDKTVLGMDIITVESIYGFEPAQLTKNKLMSESSASEQVILPDTSLFVHSAIQGGTYFNTGKITKNPKAPTGLTVSFPKYNNYIANIDKFDKYTRLLIPMETLGIKPYNPQDTTYKWSSSESKAIVSYIQYSKAGAAALMPLKCDESVSQRWGVDISLGSPIIQVSVFVPEYVWLKELIEISETGILSNKSHDSFEGTFYSNSIERSKEVNSMFEQSDDDDWTDGKRSRQGVTLDKGEHGPIIIEPSLKRTEGDFVNTVNFNNEASYTAEKKLDNFYMDDGPKVMAWTNSAMNNSKSQPNNKLLYKSLSNLTLKKPIRLQMWLDIDRELFSMRTNPQCVFWSTKRGDGEWSRIGCHTEIDYDWRPDSIEPLLVNCTCNHLSTFAVIIDEIDIEFVPEPSLLEAVTSYSAFCVSLPILVVVLTALCLMRGGVATVSNSIHKHLVVSVFMAELIYFVALKGRTQLVQNEFACKLIAMSLHYWWLAALAWCACDAWQLRRLLREVRDVNHGPLAAHYAVGYAAPAVALALAAGAHQHQYGNALFCWVSCHEAVVWWVVGPAGALCLAAILCLIAAARAAFTLRDHVCGFGNLRVLLGVSMVCMPLLACAWASALLLASENSVERRSALTAALSASVLAHAVSAALGYCILNVRVRDNLTRTLLCCLGKKVPILDTSVVVNSSIQNISQGNRSALMYHNGAEGESRSRTLRHVGISASSTTSRSTTKTSSSPYSRSDRQVRHTSTSTSNYNSASDMPSYLRGFDSSLHPGHDEALRLKWRTQKEEPVEAGTESESEGSGARSLDLASSHSSDDEDTSNRRTSTTTSQTARNEHHSYLPNITEGASLNSVMSLSQVKDLSVLRPRWPPHLDSTYNGNDKTKECGRWSQETGSDNEILNHALTIKTPSPNPLPNPDLTSDTLYQISKHHGLKSAILENIHEAYVANVELSSQSTVDNRFNTMENDYDIKLGIAALEEKETSNQYDHNVQMSRQSHAHHDNPYGPKLYLPTRTSEYLYSPNNFPINDKMYNSHNFKDNDIAAMLRVDYQRKTDNNYVADYTDRMSESSDKHHLQEKYLFPYTAEEDHVSVRGINQSPSSHENNTQYCDIPHPMATPRVNIEESNENIPVDNDAETRV